MSPRRSHRWAGRCSEGSSRERDAFVFSLRKGEQQPLSPLRLAVFPVFSLPPLFLKKEQENEEKIAPPHLPLFVNTFRL
jgi:hypothetical protein